MKKSKKKVNPIVFIILSVLLLVALIVSVVFHVKQTKELNALRIEDRSALQAQLNAIQRSGYVAASDLSMGSMLTEDMLVYRTDIPSDLPQESFITTEDLGKILVVNTAAGTPI